jgi:anti-anti-sigma factor
MKARGLAVERLPVAYGADYRFSGRCEAADSAFQDDLAQLRDRIASEPRQAVLDLTRLEVANSAFVSLVVGLVANLDEKGRRLVVVGPNRRTLDLFGVVGILEAIDIRESLSS